MTSKNSDWNDAEEDLNFIDDGSLIMSDELKGQVPSLEDDDNQHAERVKQITAGLLSIIAHRKLAGVPSPIFGIVREILFDDPFEVMFKTDIESALSTVEAEDVSFDSLELRNGERIIAIPGPFSVKAQRIMEIEPEDQACVLALCLTRGKKDIIA